MPYQLRSLPSRKSQNSQEFPKDENVEASNDDEEDFVLDENSDEEWEESDSEAAFATPNFTWKKRENVPRRHDFTSVPGVKVDSLDETSSPREILFHFLTQEFWLTMMQETNRYARQKTHNRPSSHMKRWEDTTLKELYSFVGLILVMGLEPLPNVRFHWSAGPFLSSKVFQRTLSRDRFADISVNIHFSDDDDPHSAGDRAWELRPVIDILSRQFKSVYVPGQKLTVDGSLWIHLGRHHDVQYNPSKKTLKVYRLCASDGEAAGYTSAFKVYFGHDRGSMPVNMMAVVELMELADLFDKGYELSLDRWYSSSALFHHLQSRRTNAVGTVRTSQKHMPRDTRVTQYGDVDYRSSGTGILFLQWMDKKPINILSTVHTSEEVTLPPNRLSGQLTQPYHCARKTSKWYLKVFYRLLEMAVENSYAVHRVLGGTLRKMDFRLRLILQLIYPSRATTTSPSPQPSCHCGARPSVPQGHVLEFIPGNKFRRCRHCSVSGKRKMSRYWCARCEAAFCPADCFNAFHPQEKPEDV